jgi:hypothetical protein
MKKSRVIPFEQKYMKNQRQEYVIIGNGTKALIQLLSGECFS